MAPNNDIPAPADGPAYDPLPEQEANFRPAVRFGNVPVARPPELEPSRLIWGA